MELNKCTNPLVPGSYNFLLLLILQEKCTLFAGHFSFDLRCEKCCFKSPVISFCIAISIFYKCVPYEIILYSKYLQTLDSRSVK